jgi:hypothetical protein
MHRLQGGILVLLLGLSMAVAGDERRDKPATPAEQYKALFLEFHKAGHALRQATTEEERTQAAARVVRLSPQLLALAEKNPNDPAALDALVLVVTQGIWLENNTSHPGSGKDGPAAKAIALMLRDYLRSDRLGEACRRVMYGFSKECETFLRTVLKSTPHREIQAVACLRLGQFLNGRLQRLDLLKEQPALAKRYEGLFGKDYLGALQRQDRARAAREVEALFERAAKQYGSVKLPFGGTVGERARAELHEIRHLAVGKVAQDIEGEDQDGKRFKLSDYRGKVVLLYFWSEY